MIRYAYLICIFLSNCIISNSEVVSYENFRVYKIVENFPEKCPVADELALQFEVLKVEKTVNEKGIRQIVKSFLVPPTEEDEFLDTLRTCGHSDYWIDVENLGQLIEEEKWSMNWRRFSNKGSFYENYHSYDEIIGYLESLKSFKNPRNGEPLTVVDKIGKSYEGRDMYLVKISSNHSAQKPVMLFEVGIHAREWTAPVAALYIMFQLVENFTANAHMLDKVDFYLIPVSNPDGYEYSRTVNRLWRKTRSLYKNVYGTDGNRNFDFHWGEGGTSSDPRSEIFKGPAPFSEPETRNIRDVGFKYKNRITAFLSVHNFGPYILYPWGYKNPEPAPQAKLMKKVAVDAAKAIKNVDGTEYTVGVSWELLYEAAGGADDYFKGVLNVPLTYTVELSSGGEMSFIVPAWKLHGIVSEFFEGVKVFAKNAGELKPSREEESSSDFTF